MTADPLMRPVRLIDSPVPGVVHRYPDRVLLLVTGTCPVYCRYCTRSRMVGFPGGEYEFNMGLGAQRAENVKVFVVGLGLPVDKVTTSSRGKLDASGSDEAGWANDRRVDIEVR